MVVWLERLLIAVSGLGLVAMMVLMTADAIGRYLLGSPVTGGYEVIELLMGFVVFAAIPVVTLRRAHIVVDLFTSAIPRQVRRPLNSLSSLACFVVSAGFAWILWERGVYLARVNETTQNLGVPQAAIAYLMAATWLLCAGAFLFTIIDEWRRDLSSARRRSPPSKSV